MYFMVKRLEYFMLTALLSILSVGITFALDHEAVIEKANGLYSEGEFTAAAELYEQVISDGKEASELYYNLGNAYYKAGNIPAGILNYERAKKLSPNDEDLVFNLKLANLKTVDKIEAIPNFIIGDIGNELKDLYSQDAWAWISVIGIWLASLLFFAFVGSAIRGLKKLFFVLSMIALLLSLIAFTFTYNKYLETYKEIEAIVFSPTITIKSSPDEKGIALFVLHEGTKVLVLDKLGGWYKIKLASGSIGWIPLSSIEQI
ncbi:MAG TPA: tetratricopeptide repeat protein [Flavobacteriales bacterium]|nr:tetratricopeptide repeat protein [Flavobacteriales bacterium]HIN39874.1 tetratricopeptide repeat protein [Flavobacteriales bacterium]